MMARNLVPQPDRTQVGLASVAVAAAFMSVSRNHVYQLINSGEIPSKKFGNATRIPWAWLHAQAEIRDDDAAE